MVYRTRITTGLQSLNAGLSFLWAAGLLCGAGYAISFPERWVPILKAASGCGVRWTGALCVTLFPMLISFVGVLFFGRKAVWILCAVRSLLMGIAAGAVGLCWGIRAPVMAGMLLFSSLLSSFILMVMWNHLLCTDLRGMKKETAFLTGIQFLIAAADTLVVSPFLMEVINF